MAILTSELSVFFETNGIPWIILAWLSIYVFRPIATIVHEMGHALLARVLTKENVRIRIGAGENIFKFKLMRIEVEISFKKMIHGHTAFNGNILSKMQTLLVLISGPLSSIIALAVGILTIYQTKLFTALDAVLVGWICSNLLCFLRNILPFYLQGADQKHSKGVPSDGLQIYWLLRKS